MKTNYKKLLSEKQFLKVQQRARSLRVDGTDLLAIYYKDRRVIFKTRSGTNKNIIWTQTIEISEATMNNILSAQKFKDIEDIIRDSELKIHCDCPAFTFWGYKYIAWKKGYGLAKEIRRPVVRNPHMRGFVCKHLYLVLLTYPFWSKSLASKFKKYYNSQLESKNPEIEVDD